MLIPVCEICSSRVMKQGVVAVFLLECVCENTLKSTKVIYDDSTTLGGIRSSIQRLEYEGYLVSTEVGKRDLQVCLNLYEGGRFEEKRQAYCWCRKNGVLS